MPRGDGTGPQGTGPRTGRGAGTCSPNQGNAQDAGRRSPRQGRGLGQAGGGKAGRGRGQGRGGQGGRSGRR